MEIVNRFLGPRHKLEKKNMSKDFYKNYDYMARRPYFIERNKLSDREWWLLTESDRFRSEEHTSELQSH